MVDFLVTSHDTGQARLLMISKCISWLNKRLGLTLRVCRSFWPFWRNLLEECNVPILNALDNVSQFRSFETIIHIHDKWAWITRLVIILQGLGNTFVLPSVRWFAFYGWDNVVCDIILWPPNNWFTSFWSNRRIWGLMQYEWNARTQITMWFDNTLDKPSALHDYCKLVLQKPNFVLLLVPILFTITIQCWISQVADFIWHVFMHISLLLCV